MVCIQHNEFTVDYLQTRQHIQNIYTVITSVHKYEQHLQIAFSRTAGFIVLNSFEFALLTL